MGRLSCSTTQLYLPDINEDKVPLASGQWPLVIGRNGDRSGSAEAQTINVTSGDSILANQTLSSDGFCEGNGSLHHIATDMLHYSSPPGSSSYIKLKHILGTTSHFYIKTPNDGFFTHTTQSYVRMLRGYGLERCHRKTLCVRDGLNSSVILIDTFSWNSDSLCPLKEPRCLNQPRIYIQSEQFES